MSAPRIERVVVAGAGAWGTALALAAVRAGRRTVLLARDAARAAEIGAAHENARDLPGVPLPEELAVSAAPDEALSGTDALLLAVPAQALRTVAAGLAPHVAAGTPAVIAAKGIERGSLAFMSDVLAEAMPQAVPAALSGPSFAIDVARGLPTAVTLAAAGEPLAEALARALASPMFRPYHSTDLRGVEIGGAAKNVLAIAVGIAAGRALGKSAEAALVARGVAELARLGRALGARPETIMGLSGLGDLVLTATSPQSRNFALGHAIGAGAERPAKLAEGAFTAQALVALAARHGVDMPIAQVVDAVLDRRLSVGEALDALLARPLKSET